MRTACPVDGVLQTTRDAPVVLGCHKQHRIHFGVRILERSTLWRVIGIEVVVVQRKVPYRNSTKVTSWGANLISALASVRLIDFVERLPTTCRPDCRSYRPRFRSALRDQLQPPQSTASCRRRVAQRRWPFAVPVNNGPTPNSRSHRRLSYCSRQHKVSHP